MSEEIPHLCQVLSSGELDHKIEHDLRHILKKYISNKKHLFFHMRFGINFKNDKRCYAFCEVKKNHNVFNEDFQVLIKPDWDKNRALRIMIQEGANVEQDHIDYDRPEWSDLQVFKAELKELEKDLIHMIKKLKKAA